MSQLAPSPDQSEPSVLRQVADAMADVTATLQAPIDLDEALAVITRSAADTIPGITEASISVTSREGEIRTLAPTGPGPVRADELQYEFHEGPCLQAALEEPMVLVEDLAHDPRWPQYGPRAAELGFGAQLAFQFRAEPHARGALNLYAAEPHSIDPDMAYLGGLFAGQVAVAMGWARENRTMSDALATRNLIGQAIGIVMERYRLDSERAFDFLVRLSQSSNTKLRQIAADLVGSLNDTARPKPPHV